MKKRSKAKPSNPLATYYEAERRAIIAEAKAIIAGCRSAVLPKRSKATGPASLAT